MSKHRVLFINDTHIGSVWGLWPPKYNADHDRVLPANEAQIMLWGEWERFKAEIAKAKPDTVIFDGDIVDGPGYHSGGREQMTTDLMDQVLAAEMVHKDLLRVAKPSEAYVLSGSDYHSSRQQDLEREFSEIIGAKYLGQGPHDMVFDGTAINVSHGGGGAYWYRGTKLDKIGFAMLLSIAGEGLYDARTIVRGHYHFEAHLHYRHQDMYISPCWQLQTSYMRKKDALKMIPNIGSLELTIEDGVVTPRFYGYRHPPRPKTFVEGYSIHPEEGKKKRRLRKW